MSTTLAQITNMRAEADAMLAQHVADNPTADAELLGDLLTPDQRHLLNLAGFEKPTEVQMEVGRVRLVAELKQKAGSVKARKAAERAAAAAAKALRDEAAEIKHAIAEAEAKLQVLENEARRTAGERDAMLAAVDHLKSDRFLPRHVVEQAAFARRRVKASGLGDQLRELESQMGTLQAAVDIEEAVRASHESDPDYRKLRVAEACEARFEFAKRNVPDAATKTVFRDRIDYTFNEQAWHDHVIACRRELVKAKAEAAKLKAQFDQELSLCEGCRSHYVDQIG